MGWAGKQMAVTGFTAKKGIRECRSLDTGLSSALGSKQS